MPILIIKILIAPLLIGLTTLASRKYGHTISGLLVGLPLTSGPIAFILALQHGITFAITSSKGILLGIIAVGVFSLTYAWTAKLFHWTICLLTSWGAFFIVTFFLNRVNFNLYTSFLFVVVSLSATLFSFPEYKDDQIQITPPMWDIPLRMIVATIFIIGLTNCSKILGAQLSGLLAPLPVYGTIFAGSTHFLYGANATTKLLKGIVIGSFSFASFFLIVGQFISTIGIGWTFLFATLTTLVLQGIYILLFHKKKVAAEH